MKKILVTVVLTFIMMRRFCCPFTFSVLNKNVKSNYNKKKNGRPFSALLHCHQYQQSILGYNQNDNLTPYTIVDCPPTDPEVLSSVVQKYSTQFNVWLKHKPIANHTRQAFDMLHLTTTMNSTTKIILDSGCGTARSTELLADLYPDHLVIGIDRSFVRLNRNVVYRKNNNFNTHNDLIHTRRDKPNLRLVRAELADFWRCCLEANLTISRHYLLYPNPYPKKCRLTSRWYAHPSFPLLFRLGGSQIIIKSNWNLYLQEFSQAVLYSTTFDEHARPYMDSAKKGPVERINKSVAWTNFEKKYDDVGEKTFELVSEKSDMMLS